MEELKDLKTINIHDMFIYKNLVYKIIYVDIIDNRLIAINIKTNLGYVFYLNMIDRFKNLSVFC